MCRLNELNFQKLKKEREREREKIKRAEDEREVIKDKKPKSTCTHRQKRRMTAATVSECVYSRWPRQDKSSDALHTNHWKKVAVVIFFCCWISTRRCLKTASSASSSIWIKRPQLNDLSKYSFEVAGVNDGSAWKAFLAKAVNLDDWPIKNEAESIVWKVENHFPKLQTS